MCKIAIIGRPNVGKSTLFNRLIGKKIAFVDKTEGTTRDRNYYEADGFVLIDTGGISFEKRGIQALIKEQVDFAMEEASLILFVIDGKEGVLGDDIKILNLLRKRGKDFIVVINKMDNRPYKEEDFSEFYKLSSSFIPISSLHGININELISFINSRLKVEKKEEDGISIAIVGRPNVGKSSILNRITGKNRAIVTPISGTTRDPVTEDFLFKDKKFIFVDTAGIRKKVSTRIERGYVLSSKRRIKKGDIVWLVIDAREPIVKEERQLIEEIEASFKPYIIVFNKIDLVDKEKIKVLDKNIVSISAITGFGIKRLLNKTYDLSRDLNISIKTAILNKAIADFKGNPKIYYITQTQTKPPTFLVFVNRVELCNENFFKGIKRFLRNRFNISIPIKINIKKA